MRTLAELLKSDSKSIDQIRRAVADAPCQCRLLPPAEAREATLLAMQYGTDSILGALVYGTGGILVDSGWLRFIGCGHPDLPRRLDQWNANRVDRAILVADDVVGGFFAINQGAFGDDEDMYYWAPDRLQWEPIGFDFDFFLRWTLTGALSDFYQHYRWSSWKRDIETLLPADHCFSYDPPLWSGNAATTAGAPVTVEDAFRRKLAAQAKEGT